MISRCIIIYVSCDICFNFPMKNTILIFSVLYSSFIIAQDHFIVEIDATGESTLFIFQDIITSLDNGDELGLFDLNDFEVFGPSGLRSIAALAVLGCLLAAIGYHDG